MRLRQLASTQSVVFYAPPEVDRSIRDICQLPNLFRINSSHCVQWLLEMTCRANEQLRTLYLAQGGDFCRRTNAAFENPRLVDSVKHRNKFLKIIRQKESQTLKELYGVQTAKAESFAAMTSSSQVKEFMAILESKAGSKDGKTSMATASAFEEVEQEREVEFQVEEVREVQRPSHYKPLSFPGLHENIMKFILTGVLSGAGGYQQVFAALGDTSLGKKHKLQATNSRLFVSTEFMRSIDLPNKREPLDEFTVSSPPQLPPAWIENMLIVALEVNGVDSLGSQNPDCSCSYPRGGRDPPWSWACGPWTGRAPNSLRSVHNEIYG